MFERFINKKVDYKSLIHEKVILFIKDIHVTKVVVVLGTSKYGIRVKSLADNHISKYSKDHVVILPYNKDVEEELNRAINKIRIENGILKKVIDTRSYEFK